MTIAVQAHQDTGPLPVAAGPLTVPLQIITAAGARHRVAVARGRAVPAWALLAAISCACAAIAVAVIDWHGAVSVLLIAAATIGTAATFALDIVETVQHGDR